MARVRRRPEQLHLEIDGLCSGPLFAPCQHIRPPVRPLGKAGVIHRAQTRQRTPPWADMAAIREFYKEAKRLTAETGELHVVDHIIPKMGGIVSGLHVETNLRVIHWLLNTMKGAAWWPGCPQEQNPLFPEIDLK